MGDKIIICNKEFVLDEIGFYIGKMYVKGRETDFMLDLDADPDYLMGHLACMEIDSAYGVECGGMNG